MKRYGYLAMAGFLALGTIAAAGCSDDDDGEEATTGGTAATATDEGTSVEADTAIVVTDAWCRTSPASAENGACYMMIENTGDEDDALVDAQAPTSVAAKTEVHEVVMADGGMTGTSMADDGMSEGTMAEEGMTGTSMAGGGEMEMREVDQVDLPAGETVELKPGSYHIMLLELAAPLETGSTIEVTLEFEKAGSQTVEAEVRES
ncbi:MAG: copper chaperone PCu(A)C [Acidimicrobiales bacterium]|jgi:hypothetical protein|nr:copper chaperone PCu(A)C [Acidimicrobiales bacterium]